MPTITEYGRLDVGGIDEFGRHQAHSSGNEFGRFLLVVVTVGRSFVLVAQEDEVYEMCAEEQEVYVLTPDEDEVYVLTLDEQDVYSLAPDEGEVYDIAPDEGEVYNFTGETDMKTYRIGANPRIKVLVTDPDDDSAATPTTIQIRIADPMGQTRQALTDMTVGVAGTYTYAGYAIADEMTGKWHYEVVATDASGQKAIHRGSFLVEKAIS